jgi:hypothetical protein
MTLDLERYNERIKETGKEVLDDIKEKANEMNIQHRSDSPSNGSSVAAMKDKYKVKDDAVNVISFTVRRSLIYRHKGAGKGKGGTHGSSWVDKFGVRKSTNPKSFGKMNTGNRTEAPFINDVLNSPKGVDKIATVAAEELGDAIVNNMLVK